MKELIPVAILVRVSTDKQSVSRQVSELANVAKSRNWQVIQTLEECVSGKADEGKRTGLAEALKLARSGKVKKILVHEVSRLARKNSVAHQFIEELEEWGVSLYWHSQGIETLLDNGKRNPAASLMFSMLAEMARSERETIVERINSGLEEAKRKGVVLGRRKGSGMDEAEFLAKHKDVVKRLRRRESLEDTAKTTGKSYSTIQRVKRIMVQIHSLVGEPGRFPPSRSPQAVSSIPPPAGQAPQRPRNSKTDTKATA